MTHANIIHETDIDENASLETCESMILCLQNGRFVVIRHNDPKDLWPIDGGWQKMRELQPGDEVVYKGDLTNVRAVEVYR
jgi:hypothetical protein